MREVVGDFTHQPVGSTFFQGSKPTDGVWATSDISVCNTAIMPASYGTGDHHLFVIDFAAADTTEYKHPKCGCGLHQDTGGESSSTPTD